MTTAHDLTHDTIVIGAGQAGLAVGRFLAAHKVSFTILDGAARVGDAWRQRWDSLCLHSPAGVSGLPGLPFPAPPRSFPHKDQVADYLERYAAHFRLPVETEVRVMRLARAPDGVGYEITTAARTYRARHVVVATGTYQRPHTPAFAAELDPAIVQVHTAAYRNPAQIPAGRVLVVGAGNSGAEIAIELARAGRSVRWSGRDTGRVPARALSRIFGLHLYWWLLGHIMHVRSPIGRCLRSRMLERGTPLIGYGRDRVTDAGAIAVPRIAGVSGGRPRLDDGRVLAVRAVVWATGYRPAFEWIELPIFDDAGRPRHDRGVVAAAPGLYFCGLFFQSALTSSLLGGVGADASRIANLIAAAAGQGKKHEPARIRNVRQALRPFI
jgi:putative flavoprotein involved in K+ transport